jgi:hypothetical protein
MLLVTFLKISKFIFSIFAILLLDFNFNPKSSAVYDTIFSVASKFKTNRYYLFFFSITDTHSIRVEWSNGLRHAFNIIFAILGSMSDVGPNTYMGPMFTGYDIGLLT